MESIEKLRSLSSYILEGDIDKQRDIHQLANEIEAELSEKYMALPLDADGVPIRVGDIVKCTFADDNATVKYLSLQEDGWSIVVDYPDGRGHRTPESMRHVKPRTVEDVLREFASVGIRVGSVDGIEANKFKFYADNEAIAKYAAELMMVDE